MKKTMVELFAGVGGIRLGFEKADKDFETVWFSQWEPGKTKQWAHDCYVYHFGECLDDAGEKTTNNDISEVNKNNIPEHTVLTGGFPCQDYSVAHPLSSSKGIEGKKGVLWWQIRDTMIAKRPAFCVFENVDRLLKSPASQRGRDFGIILNCLASLGYRAEWRVINAAEYGAGQRRRRVFIYAYRQDTNFSQLQEQYTPEEILTDKGFMAESFPINSIEELKDTSFIYHDINERDEADEDLIYMTNKFSFNFENAGYMKDGVIYTAKVTPKEEEPVLLGELLEDRLCNEKYIPDDKMSKWTYLKGAKKIERTSKTGYTYTFSEGGVAFPDAWDKPGRTMLTSEGTINRSSHVVADKKSGRLRILTPIETERLQGFEDNWTENCLTKGEVVKMPERMRYFCMGNALVVDMIERMAKVLSKVIEMEP